MNSLKLQQKTDPILFEVIRNALTEATEEMSASLQRTAFSTNVKTRLDYSSAFVDARGRTVAQAFCQPAHLVTMGRLVPRAVAEYGPENLVAGDALVVNDPHRQASHLNDIFLISPFFYEGRLLGYVANTCHHVDVGGGAPASIGVFREIYQEGIILPVVKLASRGEIVEDVMKLLLANVRAKHEVAGDLRAQVAANSMGIRRLEEIISRYGVEVVLYYIDKLIEYSEARARAALSTLPRGTFEAEAYLDDDGITPEPIHLKTRVHLNSDNVLFDFTGSDPQRAGPMNCNLTMTFTACIFVLKCLIDPDIPLNDGFYRVVEVIAPEGSVVNPRHPASIVGGWEVSLRLCELLFKALSPPLPERVPAGTKGMICQVGFGGRDPRSGNYYCFYETLAGGYGGRAESDGPDAVQCHIQNTQNAPIEETESNYPVRIVSYGLIPDSEGSGRHRGGLGLFREYTFLEHEPVFTTLAERRKFAPWGLFGGDDGKPARYLLISETGVTELPSKSSFQVRQGEIIRVETCGGGGYGLAWRRDASSVLRDVIDRKISAARAREAYAVVIDPATGLIDVEQTNSLRESLEQRFRDNSLSVTDAGGTIR